MKEETGKHTWRVVLAYDGTDFHGWQVQPGHRTVQGELAAAVESIVGEQILPQGSGRTDAGVHALAQVASFQLAAKIPRENLVRALNRRLPAAVRVLEACPVPEDFHARHSARGKTYEYRIFCGEICPPWLARYVFAVRHTVDAQAMQQAAQAILGENDFTSFAATDPDSGHRNLGQQSTENLSSSAVIATDAEVEQRGNRRTIFASSWFRARPSLPEFVPSGHAAPGGDALQPGLGPGPGPDLDPDLGDDALETSHLLIYRVRGSGFLHHMVRNLVGTFLDVGRGALAADAIPGILAAQLRSKAGPTAPARGLFLTAVDYPSQFHCSASSSD